MFKGLIDAMAGFPWWLVVATTWAALSQFFVSKVRMPLPVNKLGKAAMWVLNPPIVVVLGTIYLAILIPAVGLSKLAGLAKKRPSKPTA